MGNARYTIMANMTVAHYFYNPTDLNHEHPNKFKIWYQG